MDHAEEPTAEVNAPQNEEIVAAESSGDHLPRGNSTRDMDTMIDDGEIEGVDAKVGRQDVAANADADSEDDKVSNTESMVKGSDTLSTVAVDQAEQAAMSTIAQKPQPMDVDGSEPDEQRAPSGEMERSPTPAGESKSASDGADDDSQPAADASGAEASVEMEPNRSADDGTASLNEDDDKMDSSVLIGSDTGKSEETVSIEDDGDRNEIISSERAALEDAYGPFIHPTDMCLDDARKRLRIAIEQTRILRESFNDQAYERFRVVMRPVPTSIDEIVDPIEEDPIAAVSTLRENSKALQVEKDKEMGQSQQTGIRHLLDSSALTGTVITNIGALSAILVRTVRVKVKIGTQHFDNFGVLSATLLRTVRVNVKVGVAEKQQPGDAFHEEVTKQKSDDVPKVAHVGGGALELVRKSNVPIQVRRQNELLEAYELDNKKRSEAWNEFEAVSSNKIFRGSRPKPLQLKEPINVQEVGEEKLDHDKVVAATKPPSTSLPPQEGNDPKLASIMLSLPCMNNSHCEEKLDHDKVIAATKPPSTSLPPQEGNDSEEGFWLPEENERFL